LVRYLQCILKQFCEVPDEYVEFKQLLEWIESGQRITLGQQVGHAKNNSESKICQGTAAVESGDGMVPKVDRSHDLLLMREAEHLLRKDLEHQRKEIEAMVLQHDFALSNDKAARARSEENAAMLRMLQCYGAAGAASGGHSRAAPSDSEDTTVLGFASGLGDRRAAAGDSAAAGSLGGEGLAGGGGQPGDGGAVHDSGLRCGHSRRRPGRALADRVRAGRGRLELDGDAARGAAGAASGGGAKDAKRSHLRAAPNEDMTALRPANTVGGGCAAGAHGGSGPATSRAEDPAPPRAAGRRRGSSHARWSNLRWGIPHWRLRYLWGMTLH
jgi:hypothetical protein